MMIDYRVYPQATPPFHVETFRSGYAAVLDANGINWVTFPGKPGATLADPETAREIAADLNRSDK